MFQSYPYYRFLLHLYVQIHIIVVRWDWNVLKLLEKSYHCAGVGCSDQIARNLNIILCMEAQMLPSCLQKKTKRICSISLPLVMFMVFWPLYWYAIIVVVNHLTSQPSICMSSWCQALCSWDNDYTCHKIAKVHQSRVIVSLFWHMTLPHSTHNKHLCRKG